MLATFGSLGDLNPFLAVALALRARGHDCTVMAAASYRERVTPLGLGFASLTPDLVDLQQRREVAVRAMALVDGSRWLVRHFVVPSILPNGRELLDACRGADALVSSTLVVAAQPVAERLGIPRIAATLQPQAMFSCRDASIYPQFGGASRWLRGHPTLNRALHRLGAAASRSWFAPRTELRRELGLAPSGAHPIYEAWAGASAHLAMFSRHFAPDPGDWDAGAVQTGFAFHDAALPGPALSPELTAFLDAGDPPLVFTLGSAAVWVAGGFYAQAFAAARALGRRAVLLTGDDPASAPRERHPDVHVASHAAYSQLFPRAAAVVSSGGIGTVAQALRAGRPMLLVPWSHDQPDNAERVARLGAGRVLPRRELSARALENAIGALLADHDLAARAAQLGAGVRAEDGAARAADVVQGVLRGA